MLLAQPMTAWHQTGAAGSLGTGHRCRAAICFTFVPSWPCVFTSSAGVGA